MPQGIQAKAFPLTRRRRVITRAAHLRPASVGNQGLEVDPIKFAIAQKDHRGPLRDQPLDQLDQGDMERLGKGPLGTLAPPPGQRQGAALRRLAKIV